jgi:hypothetical protein
MDGEHVNDRARLCHVVLSLLSVGIRLLKSRKPLLQPNPASVAASIDGENRVERAVVNLKKMTITPPPHD